MIVTTDARSTENALQSRDEVASLTVGGATELAVVADIRQELVDLPEALSYGTRLRILLRTLHAIGVNRVEQGEKSIFPGVIERLDTIHHTRWTLADKDRKMSMAVVFDSPLEPYLRRLVEDAHTVLNVILCHCEDYRGDQGFAEFAGFVRRYQAPCELFGSGVHGLTVDDKSFLKRLERDQREGNKGSWDSFDQHAATLLPPRHPPPESDEDRATGTRQALRALSALYRLDRFFPPTVPRDRHLFHQMVLDALPGFKPGWIPANHPARKRFDRELAWFEMLIEKAGDSSTPPSSTAPPSPESLLELVQGDILQPYRKIDAGCLVMFQFGTPSQARDTLALLQPHITTVDREGKVRGGLSGAAASLFFTARGLRALGLGDDELSAFPADFRSGMEARAALLGDSGSNHPGRWERPRENFHSPGRHRFQPGEVDAVLQLQVTHKLAGTSTGDYTGDQFHRTPLYSQVAGLAGELEKLGTRVMRIEPMFRMRDADNHFVDHFGFRDGISQPSVWQPSPERDRVPVGELLLGHPDRHGERAVTAEDSLLYNGSFMVLRKLAQNVEAFDQFTADNSSGGDEAELLRAKILGRRPDGTPLVESDSLNDFDYSEDRHGTRCPLDAHVRRANPRSDPEGKTPRIARRGFSYQHAQTGNGEYGECGENGERGLLFMAYNASIAEQFEIIQRWINGGNSTGRPSTQVDPLLGPRANDISRTLRIPRESAAPQRYELPQQPLVTLRWGLYLFCPSLRALEQLCRHQATTTPYPEPNVARGQRLLREFDLAAENDPLRSSDREAWRHKWQMRLKTLLEDISAKNYREDVWAAIRANGGARSTAAGVLVASGDLIGKVLRDRGAACSTREYARRMGDTLGVTYLGMDPAPASGSSRYGELAPQVNPWLAGFSRRRAFDDSYGRARDLLDSRLIQDPESGESSGAIDLDELVRDTLGELTADWFGIPRGAGTQIGGDPAEVPHCPLDFLLAAQYIFPPHPSRFLTGLAQQRCPALRQVVDGALAGAAPEADTLLAHLRALGWEQGDITDTVAGASMGFIAPTMGSLLSVLRNWIHSGDLWRYQGALRACVTTGSTPPLGATEGALLDALIRAMQEDPHPGCLHRRAARDQAIGGVDLKEGEEVILGMVSGAHEQLHAAGTVSRQARLDSVFGGPLESPEGGPYATHACPGRDMALGTMLGLCAALLLYPGTLRSNGGLQLSLNEAPAPLP